MTKSKKEMIVELYNEHSKADAEAWSNGNIEKFRFHAFITSAIVHRIYASDDKELREYFRKFAIDY